MGRDYPDWSTPVVAGIFTLAGQSAKLVGVTGTAVPLAAVSTRIQQVFVKARATNAATVYVGTSTVTADETATGGYQLSPGDYVAFPETDLAHVYVNGTAADGVSFMWFT